jgi:hypothetical protein
LQKVSIIDERMTIFERARFAAAATVVLIGLLMLVDMVFNFDWVHGLFSPLFVGPLYVVMVVAAPFLSRFIKYK